MRRSFFFFFFRSLPFPNRSLRTRGFGLSAEEAPRRRPRRRRRRRARIWSRRAGEVLTFHDGARSPPRPPRIPLFAGHGTDARRRRATTDAPNSRVAAVLRASARGPYAGARAEPRLARIRTYALRRLTPLSVDFKLTLSRFYRWDALISRSFSLRSAAYHLD